MSVGYNRPLYILPFDHRASFQTGLFGWKGQIDAEQTAEEEAAAQIANRYREWVAVFDNARATVA